MSATSEEMAFKSQYQEDPVDMQTSTAMRLESQKRHDKDNSQLTQTGKKPVLKRNFGWMSILAFSLIILGTWEGSFVTFGIGLTNGGPAGLVYGFLFVWAGTLATFTSLSELVSMSPTSGGQYHWVSLLAPKSSQKLVSYITGWLTVAGWQAAVASSSYITGTLLQGLVQLSAPTYEPKLWHGTLFSYSVLLLSIFINTIIASALPKIESTLLILYIFGFFGCLVPLVWLAPHATPKEVFTTFYNSGGWNSQGTSFLVGLSGNAFAFLGADSAYHLSEEIKNAAVVVPRAIVLSIVLNGFVGFGALIAILFCLGDLETLFATSFEYPFMEVFLQATHSVAGSAVMVAIVVISVAGLAIGTMAAASRMLWAFGRDRGVPGWRYISRVNTRTSIPTISVAVTTTFAVLVGLISIGNTTAFNDVISLTLAALYSSYLMACGLLLWRRCSGSIKVANTEGAAIANLPGSAGNLIWGPFRVPGISGIAINAFACVYLIIILLFTFWPIATPITAASMNYSSLVFGAVALLSCIYYLFWAHKTYDGPIVEIDMSS